MDSPLSQDSCYRVGIAGIKADVFRPVISKCSFRSLTFDRVRLAIADDLPEVKSTLPRLSSIKTQIFYTRWSETVDYCVRAAKLFSGLRLQHWDIAICPEGPIALEVNVEGGVDVHQLAGRRGFLDRDLKKILLEFD